MIHHHTDPAAEIKRLKAQEQAKTAAWPDAMPPVDAAQKLKKSAAWPTPVAAPKKPRRASHSFVSPELPARPFQQGGYTLIQLLPILLILATAVAAALLID
jgi:hypothetical protein